MQKIITFRALIIPALSVLCPVLLLAGCATKPTTKVPSSLTDLKDLHAGVKRSEVIEKFGQPVSHGINAYRIPVEVFQFVENAPALNSKPISKKKRAANDNNKADVTVLMAQTGPLHGRFAGDLLTVQVSYDEENLIDDTRLLKTFPSPTPQ